MYSFILLRIRSLVCSIDVQRLFDISNAIDVASLNAFSSSVIATIYLSLYLGLGVICNLIISSTISCNLLILSTSLVKPSLQLNVPSTYSFNTKPKTNAERLQGIKPKGSAFNSSYILAIEIRPPLSKASLIIFSTLIFILEIKR